MSKEHQPHQQYPLTRIQGIQGYDQLTSASKISSSVSFSKQWSITSLLYIHTSIKFRFRHLSILNTNLSLFQNLEKSLIAFKKRRMQGYLHHKSINSKTDNIITDEKVSKYDIHNKKLPWTCWNLDGEGDVQWRIKRCMPHTDAKDSFPQGKQHHKTHQWRSPRPRHRQY